MGPDRGSLEPPQQALPDVQYLGGEPAMRAMQETASGQILVSFQHHAAKPEQSLPLTRKRSRRKVRTARRLDGRCDWDEDPRHGGKSGLHGTTVPANSRRGRP